MKEQKEMEMKSQKIKPLDEEIFTGLIDGSQSYKLLNDEK